MTTLNYLGWLLLSVGALYEVCNVYYAVTWLRDDKPMSSVFAVPFLLITGGIMIAGLMAKGILIVAALLVHLVLVVVIPWYGGAFRFQPEARIQWRRRRDKA